MQFKLLTARTPQTLTEKVNKHLADGWQMYDGLTIDTQKGRYHQWVRRPALTSASYAIHYETRENGTDASRPQHETISGIPINIRARENNCICQFFAGNNTACPVHGTIAAERN